MENVDNSIWITSFTFNFITSVLICCDVRLPPRCEILHVTESCKSTDLKQSITVTDYEFASLQVNFYIFARMLYTQVNLEACGI